jgi:hypothetical protein
MYSQVLRVGTGTFVLPYANANFNFLLYKKLYFPKIRFKMLVLLTGVCFTTTQDRKGISSIDNAV